MASLSIFSASFLAGLLSCPRGPPPAAPSALVEAAGGPWAFFLKLTANNLAVVARLLAGAVLLGSSTVAQLGLDGLALGCAVASSAASPAAVALLLLPHGAVELPAVVVAGAVGLRLAYMVVRYLAGGGWSWREARRCVRYAAAAVALTVAAAWVEAFVTPAVARLADP